jgi:hypothetical protein
MRFAQMKSTLTHLSAVGLLTVAGWFTSGCSSTPEQAATDNKVYYQTLNDSIAMTAVFKSVVMDTTYLGAGPNAGEVSSVEARWAWKAPSVDSLKVRYPEAQVEVTGAAPITVYYMPQNSSKAEAKYELNYSAELPSLQQAQGDLGTNGGVATFLKNEKGWYLMNNIYNTYAREQREAATKAAKESGNERLVTLSWSADTRLSGGMACAQRSYKDQTFYGSRIMEVPKGQTWIPVEGKSKLRPDSRVFFDVQVEADDESPSSGCYFGSLRYLPENKTKNVARAKDEFHKYYEGTKLRLWGRLQSNEVTMLVIGPGALPSGAVAANSGTARPVPTAYTPEPARMKSSTQLSSGCLVNLAKPKPSRARWVTWRLRTR